MAALRTKQEKKLSPGELSQRVAVIKRFKELLKAQRDRFRAYLDALDRQKDVILGGTTDDLIRHVELEEKIVADIFSIQKVIDPLEKMYQSMRTEVPAAAGAKADEHSGGEEVVSLREALAGLRTEAVVRSEQNRALLSARMAELRSEIKSLRNNAFAFRKPAFDNAAAATQIDIKG
jgi:uncharacterized small protein (DUF1192 family)